ncbi:hypothetical protein, partial [Flavobacterium davisii]|uniref:hypothetical protein n=1 Tax=Flavobacterium davisii TaxID=2906077 RepID=UPI0010562FF7
MFLKNKSILLCLILFSNFITAQGVIEYDEEYPVDFLIYDSSNTILVLKLPKPKLTTEYTNQEILHDI